MRELERVSVECPMLIARTRNSLHLKSDATASPLIAWLQQGTGWDVSLLSCREGMVDHACCCQGADAKVLRCAKHFSSDALELSKSLPRAKSAVERGPHTCLVP